MGLPENDQSISVVMPVTLTEKLNEPIGWRFGAEKCPELRLELAFRSCSARFPAHQISDFLIITPESQVAEIQDFSDRYLALPNVSVLSERSVLRESALGCPGWYLQQIIKLAAASLVNSSFYLTLDADIVCLRRWSVSDLIHGSRALMNRESIDDYLRLYNPDHARREVITKTRRYRASAAILDYQRDVAAHPYFYGETPVVLNRSIVLELQGFLRKLHRQSWQQTLAENRKWTEYGLYFQYLESTDRLMKYHQPVGSDVVLDLSKSVWQATEWYREKRTYAASHFLPSDSDGYFVAIQSWLNPDHWLPENYSSLEDFYRELKLLYA